MLFTASRMFVLKLFWMGLILPAEAECKMLLRRGAQMNIFTQHNPTKLYFGKGQISQLSAEVASKESPSCLWRRKY